MSKLLSDKTVASFGDGPGVYKREIDKLGHVKLHDPFDCARTVRKRAMVESGLWISAFHSMVSYNMIG
jgi:hypothetical protein